MLERPNSIHVRTSRDTHLDAPRPCHDMSSESLAKSEWCNTATNANGFPSRTSRLLLTSSSFEGAESLSYQFGEQRLDLQGCLAGTLLKPALNDGKQG